MENHEIESEIEYTTTIVKDGREYFQSYAHQLAKHICSKKYSEFELSAEYGFTSAKIYFQSVVGGSTFEKTRKSQKNVSAIYYSTSKTIKLFCVNITSKEKFTSSTKANVSAFNMRFSNIYAIAIGFKFARLKP